MHSRERIAPMKVQVTGTWSSVTSVPQMFYATKRRSNIRATIEQQLELARTIQILERFIHFMQQ